MSSDDGTTAEGDDIEPYFERELLIETTRGAYVRVTLGEAIQAVTRAVVAENGGIDRGECILLAMTVDKRAAVKVVVEHPDDAVDIDDSEDIPTLAYEDAGRFGPS